MQKVLVLLLSVGFLCIYAAETNFTERFEKSSVYGTWIDIDKGKIITINSKSTFSFERLDNDLIILKNGSKKSYVKRVGVSKTKIKGRIVQDMGSKTFKAVSQARLTLINLQDTSIREKVRTNRLGYFTSESLPSGEYTLEVKKGRLSLSVPVTLKQKNESLGTFVLSKSKSAVFKSKLSMDGSFIISNRRTHEVFIEIFNYGKSKGRVCYGVSLEDTRLRTLRFTKSCKVIPAGKSIKQPLYISFNPITLNSRQKRLKVMMQDNKGRMLEEIHPFMVYKNFFNLKIKTPNKSMKGYVVLPGHELKSIDIKKGVLALPKLSDKEYKLILANTDPRQKTLYEVDIGTEQKLIRGRKKGRRSSSRRGKKNQTFFLKQSIGRYPNVGDIAVYAFKIPDSIVMKENDPSLRVRFSKTDRLGESIKYKATIGKKSMARVRYQKGYLIITPKKNANGITTVTLIDPKAYGKAKKKLFTLFIRAVDDKPRIISKPHLKALESKVYSYYFKGKDTETRYLRSKAVKLPKWLSFNRRNALLRGKPQRSDIGKHEVILSLTDGTHVIEQKFTINVMASNKAPQTRNAFFTLNEDSVLKSRLTHQAKKGQSVSFVLLKKAKHGLVTLDTSGKFTYKPNHNFFGNDNFKVKVTGQGKSSEFLVSITVNGINDAPRAQNMIVKNIGSGPVTIDWLRASAAFDADKDELSVKVVSQPKMGSLEFNIDNHMIYTPFVDTRGSEVIYLHIEDGNGKKRQVTLTLLDIAKALTPKVLQTGQKVIYHPFDDAVYRKSLLRSYALDLNKRVIKDKALKKTWYVGETPPKMIFLEAQNYCQNLKVGIVENWRLPTIKELVMLTDKGQVNPAVDTIFSDIKSDYYWTQSAYTKRKSHRWTVYMDYGNDYHHHEKSKQNVLCVREGIDFLHKDDLTPAMIEAAHKEAERLLNKGELPHVKAELPVKQSSFTALKNREVVWDKELELIWEDRDSKETATWVGAIKICEDLNFDGRGDWRLPSFNELYSIVDHNQTKASVVSAFHQVQAKPYWTSTSSDNDGDRAWGLSFSDGSDFSYDKTEQIYVRCVRDQ